MDLYLGCSYTMGMGLHAEHNFPHIISQHTGNTCINLGAGGHGIAHSYINLKRFINFYNVKNVFHYQPIYQRYFFQLSNDRDAGGDMTHASFCPGDDGWEKEVMSKDYVQNTIM